MGRGKGLVPAATRRATGAARAAAPRAAWPTAPAGGETQSAVGACPSAGSGAALQGGGCAAARRRARRDGRAAPRGPLEYGGDEPLWLCIRRQADALECGGCDAALACGGAATARPAHAGRHCRTGWRGLRHGPARRLIRNHATRRSSETRPAHMPFPTQGTTAVAEGRGRRALDRLTGRGYALYRGSWRGDARGRLRHSAGRAA